MLAFFVLRIAGTIFMDIEKTINDIKFGLDIAEEFDGIVVKYENLLLETREWCINICKSLGVNFYEDWYLLVLEAVSNNKKPYALTEEEKEYISSQKGYKNLCDRILEK